MMDKKYFAWIALIGTVSIATNIFLTYEILTIKKNIVIDKIKEYQDNAKSGSIWRAAYNQAMEEKDLEIQISYEEGYHKATEDMSCPAGGTSSQGLIKIPEKK